MSSMPSFQTDLLDGPGQSSNGLTLNLNSNNPFRNRAASPANADALFANKPASPFDDPPSRPLSRNPFLDNPPPLRSPGVMSSSSDHKSLSAEDIFDSLTLDDKSAVDRTQPPLAPTHPPPVAPRRPMDRPAGPQDAARRGENVPPPAQGNHRPSRSQEEALKARRPKGPPRPGPGGSTESPQRRPPPQQQRRPRRNSESSLMDFDAKPLTEEEKRMIESKRREARRGRDTKEGPERSSSTKPGRPSRRMDIIDKLDATSIYGTGLFHHDGPFDALNPHRNRQSSRRAPMQAFPKDSLNNSLGGAGPLNATADHSVFMGNATDEAFRDYATGKKPHGYSRSREAPVFDAGGRSDVVHGDESYGLGTSTFLEGTPAARSAIVRHQEEQAKSNAELGLQRKKSLAQRIRHINNRPRDFNTSGRMTNPDANYNRISPDTANSNGSDNNPFFSEFSKGEESISVRRRDGAMSPTSPPVNTRRPSVGILERRATTDAAPPYEESSAKPTGILGRMKSLKGGKRTRNDGMNPAGPANPVPGTAV